MLHLILYAIVASSQADIDPNVTLRIIQCESSWNIDAKNPNSSADVTAYSSVETCKNTDCIMASGKKAYVGAIACPRNISFSQKVKIDESVYTCEDRTALKYDGRYDIFMGYGQEAYKKAIQFGKQQKEVKILYEESTMPIL